MIPSELRDFITKLETAAAAVEAEITKLQEKETTDQIDEEIDGLEALSMTYDDAISQLETLFQHM